jgi:hypothetical protein
MKTSAVQRSIWASIGPLLHDAGFHISENTARRLSPSQIQVISLQWFGPSLAGRVGCTLNSFAVRLGCYFTCIPSSLSLDENNLLEAHCHIRKTLLRTFKQSECKRKDIWFVDTAGDYLQEVSSQLRAALGRGVFSWFHRFSDLHEVLRTLLRDSENESKAFGFGSPKSPVRHLFRGFIALEVGDKNLATRDLSAALRTGQFPGLQPKLERAIDLAQLPTQPTF